MNDVANELLHGGFKHVLSLKIHSYLISSLINLSASNDISMHSQVRIEE